MFLRRFLTRIATTIITLFGVAVIVFVVIRVVPGDPIAMCTAAFMIGTPNTPRTQGGAS